MISSGIMILYGLGTVTGPVMGGTLMEYGGPKGLLWFLAVGFAVYSGYAAWRMNRRGADMEGKTDFQSKALPMQGTEGAASVASTVEDNS